VPDLELTLPARAENVAVVRHALGGFGDALGLDAEALSDVKLAVTEACTNVVLHAYPDDEEGDLAVTATVEPDGSMAIAVRDRGRGMTPRADSPGLGLGLPLIASLAEHIEVGSGPGDTTTEVRMVFRLAEPSA
jgi:anti-sigma regulatory factor (Ser/Thr protein kinase)